MHPLFFATRLAENSENIKKYIIFVLRFGSYGGLEAEAGVEEKTHKTGRILLNFQILSKF